jgi:hypothetical protein
LPRPRAALSTQEVPAMAECRCFPDPTDGLLIVNGCSLHDPVMQKAEPSPALRAAVEAIYFGDRSDYLPALWTVAKTLEPSIKDEDDVRRLMNVWYPE